MTTELQAIAEARELAERIVREYERCQIEGCDPTCLQTRLYKAWQAGRLSGLQQAAEIADHEQKLYEENSAGSKMIGTYSQTVDFHSSLACKQVARSIREKIAEQEK